MGARFATLSDTCIKVLKIPVSPFPPPTSISLLSARNTFALHMVPLNFQLAKCGEERDPKLNAFSGFALPFLGNKHRLVRFTTDQGNKSPRQKLQVAPTRLFANPPLSN